MDEIKWETRAGLGARLASSGSWFVGALCASIAVAAVLIPFTNGDPRDIAFIAKLAGLLLAASWLVVFLICLIKLLRHRHTKIEYRVNDDQVRVALRGKKIHVRGVPVYALKHIMPKPYGLKLTTGHHKILLLCDRHTARRVRHFLRDEMR